MGKKNPKAKSSYGGKVTFEVFRNAHESLELSDESLRRLYEHMSDAEAEKEKQYVITLDNKYDNFDYWENPMRREHSSNPTTLSLGARLSGDEDELKAYLDANEDHLSIADMAYLLKHIETARKVKRIQEEAAQELERGEPRPEKPEIYVDKDGFTRVDISQPQYQTTGMGCWSVAMQLIVQGRGTEGVTQKDIRAVRPEQHKIGKINEIFEKKAKEVNNKKVENEFEYADHQFNDDRGAIASEMFDGIIRFTPNSMVRSMEVGSYFSSPVPGNKGYTLQQYNKAAKELIRQTVEKAIFIDRSPLVIKKPGHFMNVVGIKGDTLLIQDPLSYAQTTDKGIRTREISIDYFVDEMLVKTREGVQLIWGSDIKLDKDGKTILGIPKDQASVDDQGKVILAYGQQEFANGQVLETSKDGVWINRFGGSDDMFIAKDEQPITKEGLLRTDQVYMPKKLNVKGLVKEAEKRSEQEKQKIEEETKIYYADEQDLRDLSIKTILEKGMDTAKQEAADRIRREEEERRQREADLQRRREEDAKRRADRLKQQEEDRRNREAERQKYLAEQRKRDQLRRDEEKRFREEGNRRQQEKKPSGSGRDTVAEGKRSVVEPRKKQYYSQEILPLLEMNINEVDGSRLVKEVADIREAEAKGTATKEQTEVLDHLKANSHIVLKEDKSRFAGRAGKLISLQTRILQLGVDAYQYRNALHDLVKENKRSEKWTDLDKALETLINTDARSNPENLINALKDVGRTASSYYREDGSAYALRKHIYDWAEQLTEALVPALKDQNAVLSMQKYKLNAKMSLADQIRDMNCLHILVTDTKKTEDYLASVEQGIKNVAEYAGRISQDKKVKKLKDSAILKDFKEVVKRLSEAGSHTPVMDVARDTTRLMVIASELHLPDIQTKANELLKGVQYYSIVPDMTKGCEENKRILKTPGLGMGSTRLVSEYVPWTDRNPSNSKQQERDARIKELYATEKNEAGKTMPWSNPGYALYFSLANLQAIANTALQRTGRMDLLEEIGEFMQKRSAVIPDAEKPEYAGYDPVKKYIRCNGTTVTRTIEPKDMKAVFDLADKVRTECEKLLLTEKDPMQREDIRLVIRCTELLDGNLLKAVTENRMLLHFINDHNGSLKKPLDKSIEGLKGLGETEKDLPKEERQDIYEAYMTIKDSSSMLIPLEYEKQEMEKAGVTPKSKEIYLAHLKASNEKLIAAYDKLASIPDHGQYDKYIDNPLAHYTGFGKTNRDGARYFGYMRGQNRAMELRWDYDELAPIGIIGGLEAEILKMEKQHAWRRANIDKTVQYLQASELRKIEQEEKSLAQWKEEFAAFKGSVWDREVKSDEDKLAVTRQIKDYLIRHPFPETDYKLGKILKNYSAELDKVSERYEAKERAKIKPVSYKETKDKDGRKIPWEYESVSVWRQYNTQLANASVLVNAGKIPDSPQMVAQKHRIGNPETGEEILTEFDDSWHGFDKVNAVICKNKNKKSGAYYRGKKEIEEGKTELRVIRDGWRKWARELPEDMEDRLIVQRYLEDYALLADPDAGNYMKATGDHPYVISAINLMAATPKFDTLGFEKTIAGLKGKAKEQEDLYPELRGGIFYEDMEMLHAAADVLRTEYYRQQLAVGDWNKQKEELYKAELIRTNTAFIKAYRALMEKPNVHQYDDYLNNNLDQNFGLEEGEGRDVRDALGYMTGVIQALNNGFSTDETDILGAVGSADEFLRRLNDQYRNAVQEESLEKITELIEAEKALNALKAEIWEKKVTTPEEKRAVAQKAADFFKIYKKTFGSMPQSTITGEFFDECVDRLNKGFPEPAPEEKKKKEDEIAKARAAYEENLGKNAKEGERLREEKQQKYRELSEAAFANGFPEEHEIFLYVLNSTELTLKLGIRNLEERAKTFGEDHTEDIRAYKAAAEELDSIILETKNTKFTSDAGVRYFESRVMERLVPYGEKVRNIVLLNKRVMTEYERPLKEKSIERYEDEARKEKPVPYNALQDYATMIGDLSKMFAAGSPENRNLKFLATKAEEIMVLSVGSPNMNPRYSEALRMLSRDLVRELDLAAENIDLKARPITNALLQDLHFSAECYRDGINRKLIAESYSPSALRSGSSIMDLYVPKEDDLKGIDIPGQQAVIDRYEEMAHGDKDFFDMLEESLKQQKLAVEIEKAREEAKAKGEEFDISVYKERMFTSAKQLHELSTKVLRMAEDKGIKLEEHPYFRKKTLDNILESRGVKGAVERAELQLALIGIGEPMEKAGLYSNVGAVFKSNLNLLEALEKKPEWYNVIHIGLEKVCNAGSASGAGIFKAEAMSKGKDYELYLYECAEEVRTKAKSLLDIMEKIPKEEKLALENIIASSSKVLEHRESYRIQKINDAVKGTETLTEELLKLQQGSYSNETKAVLIHYLEPYCSDISTPEQKETLKAVVKKLTSDLLKDAEEYGRMHGLRERFGGKDKEEGSKYEKLKEGTEERENRMQLANGLLDLIEDTAGKNFKNGKDGIEQIRSYVTEAYEESLRDLTVRREKEFMAQNAEEEASELLNRGLNYVPGLQKGTATRLQFMSQSTERFLEQHQIEDEQLIGLQEYRMRLQMLTDKAKKQFEELKKQAINREKDSKEFNAMYDALENVTKLSDKSTPKQIEDAFMTLKKATSTYDEERSKDFFRLFRGDVGSNRLKISDQAGKFCDEAAKELYIPGKHEVSDSEEMDENLIFRGIDKKKTLEDQLKAAKDRLVINGQERMRRKITLKDLEEKEARKRKQTEPEKKEPEKEEAVKAEPEKKEPEKKEEVKAEPEKKEPEKEEIAKAGPEKEEAAKDDPGKKEPEKIGMQHLSEEEEAQKKERLEKKAAEKKGKERDRRLSLRETQEQKEEKEKGKDEIRRTKSF